MGMLARLLMNLHCRIGPWPSGGAAGRRRQIRSALWCTARARRTRTSRRSMCGISSRSCSYATPSPRRPTPRVSAQRSSRGLMCVASMAWGEPYRRPVNGSHARERARVGVSMKTRARRPKQTALGTHRSRHEMPRQECSGDPSQPATPPHDRRHDGPQPLIGTGTRNGYDRRPSRSSGHHVVVSADASRRPTWLGSKASAASGSAAVSASDGSAG
jgi:hypothetical protein